MDKVGIVKKSANGILIEITSLDTTDSDKMSKMLILEDVTTEHIPGMPLKIKVIGYRRVYETTDVRKYISEEDVGILYNYDDVKWSYSVLDKFKKTAKNNAKPYLQGIYLLTERIKEEYIILKSNLIRG